MVTIELGAENFEGTTHRSPSERAAHRWPTRRSDDRSRAKQRLHAVFATLTEEN
jgi:hypothetical protein